MGIVSSLRNYFGRAALHSGEARVCWISIQKACAHIIPAKAIAIVFMAGLS
jgi:hypothetical protein